MMHIDYTILFCFQRNGFFFEAGAQDGERASNTVMFELERDWTGLLVEVDPWFYAQMRSKMRHAYTANVALSPDEYIAEVKSYIYRIIIQHKDNDIK